MLVHLTVFLLRQVILLMLRPHLQKEMMWLFLPHHKSIQAQEVLVSSEYYVSGPQPLPVKLQDEQNLLMHSTKINISPKHFFRSYLLF